MKNLLNNLVIRRRHLIVSEEDLTNVLRMLNAYHTPYYNLVVGECKTKSHMWYIQFNVPDTTWASIEYELRSRDFKKILVRKKGYCRIKKNES